jgi:hypothetical protein
VVATKGPIDKGGSSSRGDPSELTDTSHVSRMKTPLISFGCLIAATPFQNQICLDENDQANQQI